MEKKINTERELGRAAAELAEEVAPIYELLKWEWQSEGVPDKYQIFDKIIELYDDLDEHKTSYVSSGGLTASIEQDEEKEYVKLSFSIEKIFYTE